MKGHIRHRWTAVAWPAFLVAGLLEMLVFAFVDPLSLQTLGGAELPLSSTAIYSVAFMLFWACVALACWLSLLLDRGAHAINATAAVPGPGPRRRRAP